MIARREVSGMEAALRMREDIVELVAAAEVDGTAAALGFKR